MQRISWVVTKSNGAYSFYYISCQNSPLFHTHTQYECVVYVVCVFRAAEFMWQPISTHNTHTRTHTYTKRVLSWNNQNEELWQIKQQN